MSKVRFNLSCALSLIFIHSLAVSVESSLPTLDSPKAFRALSRQRAWTCIGRTRPHRASKFSAPKIPEGPFTTLTTNYPDRSFLSDFIARPAAIIIIACAV
jgi:hypothetical protein